MASALWRSSSNRSLTVWYSSLASSCGVFFWVSSDAFFEARKTPEPGDVRGSDKHLRDGDEEVLAGEVVLFEGVARCRSPGDGRTTRRGVVPRSAMVSRTSSPLVSGICRSERRRRRTRRTGAPRTAGAVRTSCAVTATSTTWSANLHIVNDEHCCLLGLTTLWPDVPRGDHRQFTVTFLNSKIKATQQIIYFENAMVVLLSILVKLCCHNAGVVGNDNTF